MTKEKMPTAAIVLFVDEHTTNQCSPQVMYREYKHILGSAFDKFQDQ